MGPRSRLAADVNAAQEVVAIRAAACAGDAHAQFRLGRFMILGLIAAESPEEPMRWINAACAQRYPLAMLFQATLAARGIARPQSFEDAIRLVHDAAKEGYERAEGQLAVLGGVSGFDPSDWLTPPEARHHFDSPRVLTVEAFLPRQACAWLSAEAGKRLLRAPIKHSVTGRPVVSEERSNSSCGFSSVEADLVLQMTDLRIAAAVAAPIDHQEPTNILHYAIGQEYRPHFDFVREDEQRALGEELRQVGQRIATCLIYLNDDFEGGETTFPRLSWSYKGRAGDALIFWNMSQAGAREPNSLHAGRPVTSGEKWLYSKWIRAKPHPLK